MTALLLVLLAAPHDLNWLRARSAESAAYADSVTDSAIDSLAVHSPVVSVHLEVGTNCVGGWGRRWPVMIGSTVLDTLPHRYWDPCEWEHRFTRIYFWTADGTRWMVQDSVRAGRFTRPRRLGSLWGGK